MSTQAEQDFRTLVAALRSALTTGSGAAERPGQLRLRLEEELDASEDTDAGRLRRLVHQVVAAAEENLPANLTRIAPLTAESLRRLSSELADARGWSLDAAQRTTRIWAAALGFEELVASSWPRTPERPQPATPISADVLEPTAAPPGQEPTPPPAKRPASWPPLRKAVAAHSRSAAGEETLGAAQAYAGMSLPLFAGALVLLVLVLIAPVLFLDAVGLLLPVVGAAVAAVLVRFLGYGALVATRSGLEFTPYDGPMRKARPDRAYSASWSEVTVEPGYFSTVRFAGHRIQLGPRNRNFADALAAYDGGRTR